MKRYDIKTEAKLLKALMKLKGVEQNCLSEETAILKERLGVMDCANVCLIEATNEEAKRVLSRFIDAETEIKKTPELDYNTIYGFSKYSAEYLQKIFNLFGCFADLDSIDSVTIKTNKDYPATFENEHFKIILAPRVNND